MTRTSKIRRLPPELREQLHSMLDAGVPLEEITAHLNNMGADVSRSGLGRYKQQVDKVAARMRESRQMAEVLMDRMGADAATGKGGAALIQMLTTLTTECCVGIEQLSTFEVFLRTFLGLLGAFEVIFRRSREPHAVADKIFKHRTSITTDRAMGFV